MRAAELGPTVVDPTDSPIGMIGLFHDPVDAPRAGCAVIDVRDRVATNLGPPNRSWGAPVSTALGGSSVVQARVGILFGQCVRSDV